MITGFKQYGVSVIMTIYNSKAYFKRALESVLNQTFRDFEIIIVDDGSTDNSEQELFPILKNNSDIKYLRHSNRRHSLSLNSGILNSTGRYIAFIDSDDEYLPEHLQTRIDYFRSNPETDLIHSPALLIGDEADMYVPDADDNTKLIHLNDCIIGGTFFGKKKVFEELEGFRNIYSHDYDFYNRVCASGKYKVDKIDSLTYRYYRNNPESIISKMKSDK